MNAAAKLSDQADALEFAAASLNRKADRLDDTQGPSWMAENARDAAIKLGQKAADIRKGIA